MTLQEAKDQVAKDHGFECWEHVLSKRNYRIEEVSGLIDEAAELYAKSKWDEACEAQKRICEGMLDLQANQNKVNSAPKPEFKP